MSNYKFETLQLHVGQEQADPATDSLILQVRQLTMLLAGQPMTATLPTLFFPNLNGLLFVVL